MEDKNNRKLYLAPANKKAMKRNYYLSIFIGLLASVFMISCGDDDDSPEPDPPRDRGEEAINGQMQIEEFLENHFYNYEEFANPPAGFDFKVVFDTIAGDNSNKIPLIQQVESKMVQDRVDEDVMYKLYFLRALQGEGASPNFPDVTYVTYEGLYLDRENFDGSPNPVRFDLTQVVNGFQDAMVEFNAASSIIDNPDGSVSFDGFGSGAVFIPSGLGYFNNAPLNVPIYAQLIFTFQLIDVEEGDQDMDGVPSIVEDVNGNGLEEDDDADEDNSPNYFDADDDNDGRPTRDEIEIDEDGNITYPDVDGDGTPDYLDSDS